MKKQTLRAFLLALVLCCCAVAASAEAVYPWPFQTTFPIDEALVAEVEHHGTVEKLTYTAPSYTFNAMANNTLVFAPDKNQTDHDIDVEAYCGDETEFTVEKSVYVYLPWNYSADKKYNIVYLLHGTMDNSDYWLGDHKDSGRQTLEMLDHLVETGECDPFIVVSTSYYSIPAGKEELFPNLWSGDVLVNAWPMFYWQELRNEIIPLVESTYSTYGNDSDARDHRAFCGLSRGSMATINSVMMHCLDQFSYFGNFSGLWCEYNDFRNTMNTEEYSSLPIHFWYNGNGTADFSLNNHHEFLTTCLEEMPDRFVDGENVAWVCFDGGEHRFNCWLTHLYNCMQVFFK